MVTRRAACLFSTFVSLFIVNHTFAQGMTLDSIMPRIAGELRNPQLAAQLRTLVPDYENQKVWGLAIGDFSNDSLPDVALSLYDKNIANNIVHLYLFENVKNQQLANRYDKPIPYIESPIEVGLSIDGSVVTVTQKAGDEQWSQMGYSIESGDVALIDRFETQRDDAANSKARAIGHEVYRNYETLRTREEYYTTSSDDALLRTAYFTLPSYQRLREVYPGYGHILSDTSSAFILSGGTFRKDAKDLSIRGIQTAYNDDYLYLSMRVRDDYVLGGPTGDRVTLIFDTKYTGDRLNRDRRVVSKEGGAPTFRTTLDSCVTSITFNLPLGGGRVQQITTSHLAAQTQQEGLKGVIAQMTYDTERSTPTGYILSVRIPFSFLNFETNPARFYEHPMPPSGSNETGAELATLAGIGDAATLGFTALIYDVDDTQHANEVTLEATSQYEQGNPSTFGTMVLEPSSLYYGEVHPTYLNALRSQLSSAGF
jgi:hypothetical protein